MYSLKEKVNIVQTKYPEIDIVSANSKHFLIRNKYGLCKVQSNSILVCKPGIGTALDKTEYFRNQLKEVQPNLKLVGLYKDSQTKVLVENEYGVCSCLPSHLLKGQTPEITSAIDKTNYFVSIAKKAHNNLYNYSKVEYKKSLVGVTIICSKHGEFKQSPQVHLSGGGCIKCGHEDKIGSWYMNPIHKSKQCTMYILEITGNKETFLKFGVTIDLKKRLKTLQRESGYKYKAKTLKSIQGTVEYCYNLEQRVKRLIKYKKLAYIPKIKFCGRFECFNKKIVLGS